MANVIACSVNTFSIPLLINFAIVKIKKYIVNKINRQHIKLKVRFAIPFRKTNYNNYSIAYDMTNEKPLLYESYPGSIVDVSQLKYMLEKIRGYGYEKIGFILDRGYFSKANIQFMDSCDYDFVMMVKGRASFVHSLIMEHMGEFESKRALLYQGLPDLWHDG